MGLIRSTAVVGGMTLVSRVLGFVRDMVIAGVFGAGAGADAFFVAFRIPNFLRRLFGEGAFNQAFVPVISEYRERHDPGAVRELVDHVAGCLGTALLLVTTVGILVAPVLIAIFAPGFLGQATKFDLAAGMLRITFPYLLFISLTALAGGILNACGRFAIPAFTPVLLNLSMIGAALFLAPRLEQPVTALAWGVFLGGLLQLGLQLPALARLGLLPRPRPDWRDPGVRRILGLMAPALFGVSVSQVNLLLDTLIASFLITGSVSWLYYSDRLVEFPLGVFGIALGTVILPSLSRSHAAEEPEHFSRLLDWALRWVLVIATPAALGLMLLAGPILTTLFQYGEFSGRDVEMASQSLMAYALGLVAFSLIKVLAPGYFSRQDTRTPVRIGVVAMFANMALNIALVFPLAHAGLALATSLAAFLNAGLLFTGLRRQGVYRGGDGWGRLALQVGGANLAMAALLLSGVPEPDRWLGWTVPERVAGLALWLGTGGGCYLLVLWLLGLRPALLRPPAGRL